MHIDYKADKLLRIDADISKGVIKSIKISGDFFIHPEQALFQIEEALTDLEVSKVKQRISEIIDWQNIKIIGFSVNDLSKAIKKLTGA